LQTLDSLVKLFLRGPLLFDCLRTIARSREPVNPRKLSSQLNRAEPTIHRVMQHLLELGLVVEQPGENGRFRFYSIPREKREQVNSIIEHVLRRGVPQALAEISETIVAEFSRLKENWEVRDGSQWARTRESEILPVPDIVLHGDGLAVFIELTLGVHHFRRRIYEIMGKLLSMRLLGVDLVVLCVFGPVREDYRKHMESVLSPIFSTGRPELLSLFVQEEPHYFVNANKETVNTLTAKVIAPILDRIQSLHR